MLRLPSDWASSGWEIGKQKGAVQETAYSSLTATHKDMKLEQPYGLSFDTPHYGGHVPAYHDQPCELPRLPSNQSAKLPLNPVLVHSRACLCLPRRPSHAHLHSKPMHAAPSSVHLLSLARQKTDGASPSLCRKPLVEVALRITGAANARNPKSIDSGLETLRRSSGGATIPVDGDYDP